MLNKYKTAVLTLVSVVAMIILILVVPSSRATNEVKEIYSIKNDEVGCASCMSTQVSLPKDYWEVASWQSQASKLAELKADIKEMKRLKIIELARLEQVKIAEERMEKEKVTRQIRRVALEKERLRRLEKKKKEAQVVSRGNNETFGQWIQFEGTYYGADCYKCSGKTAWKSIDVRNTIYYNGLRVIAVDPNVIPLGSIVEVRTPNETFKAIAADTGGKIKGYIVDILVESEAASAKYGRHAVQVRILK